MLFNSDSSVISDSVVEFVAVVEIMDESSDKVVC